MYYHSTGESIYKLDSRLGFVEFPEEKVVCHARKVTTTEVPHSGLRLLRAHALSTHNGTSSKVDRT